MVQVIKCKSEDGDLIEFEDKIIASGTMKDCYFHPNKEYAVLFYRDQQSLESKNRLDMITTRYKMSIYNQIGGDYWKDLFCWPQKIVKYNNELGFITPIYNSDFFFKNGSINNDFLKIKNKEKEGKWFASAHNQNRFLDDSEKGDWKNYLKICILISRAVRRLHASGLAHSDLSYKNILIDPLKAKICIIDNDALVVPGKYPPDVIGTPDFIAPD